MYQAYQWLWPLERLDLRLRATGRAGVEIVCRDPDVLSRLSAKTNLPVRAARTSRELASHLEAPQLRAALYPNQATLNFQGLSFAQPAHVHMSHGESEKASMVSNNLKAYDYVFTAGPAARERIAEHLIGFDQAKCIDVGRPQLDEPVAVPPHVPETARPGALYAPTWEGDSPAMSYSSVASSGPEIVKELLGLGYRVIYRPHPQLGSRSSAAADAHREVQRILGEAGGEHLVDTGGDFGWQFSAADVVVADLSAVAFDALGHGLPLLIVEPTGHGAFVPSGSVLESVPTLTPSMVDVGRAVEEALSADAEAKRAVLAERYFGDISDGAQLERFLRAVEHVVDERNEALAAKSRANVAGNDN